MSDKYRIEYDSHTRKDFEDVWNIEAEYFDSSTISSVKQVMDWDRKNKDIYVFVRDIQINKIVGECTILPISKEQFGGFLSNQWQDTELDSQDLLAYQEGNTYCLLFSAIAIDKKYRGDKTVLSYLLKGINTRINNLIKKNIKFENMCAEAQTIDGQRFIEGFLNLKEKNVTKQGYKLYSFDCKEDMKKWIRIFPLYIERYSVTIK